MDTELLNTVKETLKKEKALLEQELSSIAAKDPRVAGDWDSKHPRVPEGNEEEAADEVEEYEERNLVEQTLETRLRDVVSALAKIANNAYGTCEKCGAQIQKERLVAVPSARTCEHCM
ncbi:MAG: TraR/DksA C4-type zinc finger protein [Candidatus Sungbacteria bacterium]|uniref:TraR/DksA C4-type zinc finger protein n=1 Tax=Candidatus Sungiibacteriota bacterium TaxID=2750080 RepID=A0A931SDY7_9BACT|nr:TraR/DksA C4-type zinc finger protein [Candidatus Sungbacteria bacterium]